MAFNLLIPNPKGHNVKDVILKELSTQKNLSIIKMLNACKKNNLSVSYHAVYQAVNELSNNEILHKTNKDFSISKKYIDSLKEFTKVIEDNYTEKINLNVPTGTTVHLTFNSLNKATRFMARAAYSNVFDIIKNRKVYFMFQHLWLIQTIKNVNNMALVKKLAKLNKWYALVRGNSLVDKKLKAIFERDFNAKIKLGVNCAPIGNLIVFGDFVAQDFIPKKLIDLQEKVFNKAKDKLDLDWIEEYTRLCYLDKYRITVTITRNKELADQIKENVMKEFEK